MGTVHSDPDGFRRLTRWLEVLQPDLILVELSPYGRLFRRRRQREYQKSLAENLRRAAQLTGITLRHAFEHPEIDAIRRQICYPFEYRAARSFAALRKIPLALVDHSPFSMRCILQWPTLIAVDNLVHLLRMPVSRPPIEKQYRQAQEWLQGRDPTRSYQDLNPLDEETLHWDRRERYMADQIGFRLRAGRTLRPLFVGGWLHLASGPKRATLRSLLLLARTQCLLLSKPPGSCGVSPAPPTIVPTDHCGG